MSQKLIWPEDEALIEDFCKELEAAREDGLDVAVELPREAALIHGKAVYLSEMVQAYGYEQTQNLYFNTLVIRPTEATCSMEELMTLAEEYELELTTAGDAVRVVIDKNTDLDVMNALISLFAEGAGGMAPEVTDETEFEGLSVIED